MIWGSLVGLAACQSAEKRAEQGVDKIAAGYSHLSAYREIQCRLNVQFSEPAKSAWLKKLFADKHETTVGSNSSLFRNVEKVGFSWRATPYRCRTQSDRMMSNSSAVREVFEDTSKKIDVVMCIWLQSFYADSPLRGWKKGDGSPQRREENLIINKGEGREMEFAPDGKLAIARLGSHGVLKSEFGAESGQLLPKEINYEKGDERGRVTEFIYQTVYGREIPKSLWVHLPSESNQSLPAFRLEFSDCRWE